MNSSVDRSSELAEKDGTKCGRFMKLCVGFLRSFTKSGAEDMRNFRNFHAKITPLIAVFALVAFSIFAFTKLPAFAQNSAQDLSKTDAFSAGSEQDLNKTEVLCKDSAGSEQDVQNGSAQSVPSNEQAQTAQNSVITPLDAQTEQNQHAQDNCVQTHSAEQDLESNSPITHLNTQISAQVPSRVQSTTITPKASAGANIELSDGDETTASGTGWTYADGVYTINSGATAEANLTISGSTMNKRVVVASDTTATVTLSGSSITNGVPAFGLSSGSNLTLKLSGSNVLSTSSDDNAGLNVPGGATVTIESISEGASLTANAGNYGAGIGGGDHGSGGNITIAGGIINATGGHGGAGIGGGYCGSGGSITIAGGKITTNGGTYGAGIGGGAEASGGTINISGGTIVAINGGWSSAIGGGYEGSSTGTTNITGGTIIGLDNIGTSTT
ncbi:MAG: hypothetical protein LBI63_02960, partial [Candidatus Ancillula sp.]|nr:hypothetical protein [Candidatus Ancillula sp.]